ncbi:hypothetical protein D3C86_1971830 [compost metagenome]
MLSFTLMSRVLPQMSQRWLYSVMQSSEVRMKLSEIFTRSQAKWPRPSDHWPPPMVRMLRSSRSCEVMQRMVPSGWLMKIGPSISTLRELRIWSWLAPMNRPSL